PFWGRPRRRPSPADVAGDDRLVVRPAPDRRAAALRPDGRLPPRLHARGGRGGRGRKPRHLAVARRQEPAPPYGGALLDAGDDQGIRDRGTGGKRRGRRRARPARRPLPRPRRAGVHGAVRPRPDLGWKARRRTGQPPRRARLPPRPRPPARPPARRRARLVLAGEIALRRGHTKTRGRPGVIRTGRTAHGTGADLPWTARRRREGDPRSTRARRRALARARKRDGVGDKS